MRLLRGFALCASMLFPTAVGAAEDTDLEQTRTDLRDAIYAKDIEAVETLLSDMQARIMAGQDTHESMRYLYQVFATTHPDTIAFVEEWQQSNPSSPYASSAQARVYRLHGWNMRGQDYNYRTYPEALHYGNWMLNQGFSLAINAYASDTTLAPASDLVLDLARSAQQQQDALVVAEEVMQHRPDWGTLRRMLNLANPSYGGSFGFGYALCEHFGAKLSEPHDDMVRWCLMSLAYFYYMDDLKEEYHAWITDETQPQAEQSWVQYYIYLAGEGEDLTDAQLDRLERYFRDGHTTEYRLAGLYDTYVAMSYRRPVMEQVVLKRAKAFARETLVHDPYNRWSLETLERYSNIVTEQTETSVSMIPDREETPTDAERAEYTRLRLMAAPYNPRVWETYATHLDRAHSWEDAIEPWILFGDRALTNAVVYSNYMPQRLHRLFQRKFEQRERLLKLRDEGMLSEMGVRYSDIDIDGLIICPMIRAKRLMDAISEAQNGTPAQLSSVIVERAYARIYSEVEQAGACPDVIGAPIEALMFDPVPLDQVTVLEVSQVPG